MRRKYDLPVARAVRSVRAHRKMTHGQLAQRTGLLRTYISKVENCHTECGLDNFCKLAYGLRLEPWKLLRYVCKLKAETGLGEVSE